MIKIGARERLTQNRVIKLFSEQLGYEYLGDWQYRDNNSNITEPLLTKHLLTAGYTEAQITQALHRLRSTAAVANSETASLYEPNKAVYSLLRYGVQVKTSASEPTQTVHLIDWDNPAANHFGIAEEVTLAGENDRRPDLVLYVNGIALGIIELKSATVSLGEAIRQCISNQQLKFHRGFFTTVQLLFAGNDSEGLKYATIETQEKYWLRWKEDESDNSEHKLDKYLKKMCAKERFLELIHDFVVFDGGVKKVPRVHQYFGVKAAQKHVDRRESGIIWHTQGSGKSIVMVLLAKWILENHPTARIVIVTDRTELDKQIQGVFDATGESVHRATSGRDLVAQLGQATPRLICSLVHKFGKKDIKDFEGFIANLEANPIQVVGDLFLFVDECHRTQSGKLHRTMKTMLPEATFIGFTGTPLLKKDKATSRQVFGGYIHTYKFGEAVADNVVLDLVYEARDIQQRLGDSDDIDEWFRASTEGLSEYQKAMLREHWATMQKVLSSRGRMDRIVWDVLTDFKKRPRLSGERGTAMLVTSSIYEACRYYELFRQSSLKKRCAIITSYDPQASDISKEDTGADTDTAKELIYNTYTELLKDVPSQPRRSKTEVYEDEAKRRFRDEPATMKLLIVVDKLLTGFDAPSCTYLYLDKSMQDHGLFQAICRTNRLDGEDKDFGYIVDYKDLFKRVENAIEVYASELDTGDDGEEPTIELENRLVRSKERLEHAREALALLCEPVEPPKELLQYLWHFCGNTENASDLSDRRALRDTLYQLTARLARAFANLEHELRDAGYSVSEAQTIREEVKYYVDLRSSIRNAANETLELKAYEADMRDLIDQFIEADKPKTISEFGDMPLLDLIVKLGIHRALENIQNTTGGDVATAAETITHNVRSHIIKGKLTDPAYYEKMSQILDELIRDLRAKRIDYKAYLARMAKIAAKVQAGQDDSTPASINTPGLRVLYNNLGGSEERALAFHEAVLEYRPDSWREHQVKEREVQGIIYQAFKDLDPDTTPDLDEVQRIFEIMKNQSNDEVSAGRSQPKIAAAWSGRASA